MNAFWEKVIEQSPIVAPSTANSAVNLTLMSDGASPGAIPIDYIQEVLIFKSQPAINDMQNDINLRYGMY